MTTMKAKQLAPSKRDIDQFYRLHDEVGHEKMGLAIDFLIRLGGEKFPLKISRLRQVLGLK